MARRSTKPDSNRQTAKAVAKVTKTPLSAGEDLLGAMIKAGTF